jgi:hypothetical protein
LGVFEDSRVDVRCLQPLILRCAARRKVVLLFITAVPNTKLCACVT